MYLLYSYILIMLFTKINFNTTTTTTTTNTNFVGNETVVAVVVFCCCLFVRQLNKKKVCLVYLVGVCV